MAVSDEWEKMHLTPSGWIQGSGKYDFQGIEEKSVPDDTVLTAYRHVYVGAIGAKPQITETQNHHTHDKALIKILLEKYGSPQFAV